MRLFKDVKGFANEKNAIKKLMTVLGCEDQDELDNRVVWSVGYNGRFYPVVHRVLGSHHPHSLAALAQSGVCVTG